MVNVNDLIPSSSGRVHLGVNGGIKPEALGEPIPFGHIHMISGVWHDPIMGSSGVIRYSRGGALWDGGAHQGLFDISADGGLSFPVRIGKKTNNAGLITSNESVGGSLTIGAAYVDIRGGIVGVNVFSNDIILLGGANIVATATDTISYSALGAGGISFTASTANMLFQAGLGSEDGGQMTLQPFATSGKLDYQFGPYQSWYIKTSDASTGGPLNDGSWPIAHSGNMLEVITLNTRQNLLPLTSGRYSIGANQINTIDGFSSVIPYNQIHVNSGIFHDPRAGQSGVIRYSKQKNAFELSVDGGKQFPIYFGTISQAYPTVNESTIIGLVRSSGTLVIGGSGIVLDSDGSTLHRSVFDFDVDVGRNITIDANGFIGISALGNAAINSDANVTSIALGTFSVQAGSQILLDTQTLGPGGTNIALTANTDIDLSAGTNVDISTIDGNFTVLAGLDGVVPGGKVRLSANGGSGQLDYRFGPYQAWHVSNSNHNGGAFFPIAHSGQVNAMIQASRLDVGSGLQVQYNAGRFITTDTTPGNLEIVSRTAKTKFSTTGSLAEINMSGIFFPPTGTKEPGDLHFARHSVISGIVGVDTDALAQAKALGIGTLVVNTGSGMINVSVGSGIAQFTNSSSFTYPTGSVFGTITTVDTALEVSDTNYGLNAGVVTVFSPGLYKISYKVFSVRTVGTANLDMQAKVQKNGVDIQQSNTAATVVAASPNVSHGCDFYINAEAGDTFTLQGTSNNASAANTGVAFSGGVIFHFQKIGPKRGTF